MQALKEIGDSVARLAGEVGPSVVGIGHRRAMGSGVVVAPGKVLTNAHNLRGGEVSVTFDDGRTSSGAPAGVDLDGDLAIVDVDTQGAAPLQWSDNGAAAIGGPVFALANPGGRGLRVTFGLVSGTERSFRGPRGRLIAGSVEHTAPLLPGSSGGPIVDAEGRLLGINTNRLGSGFYLAIPADGALRTKVDELGRGRAPARPRLGVAVAPAEVARGLRRAVGLEEIDGLLVRGVDDDGPAARAGLAEGDLIVEAGGNEIASADDLFDALAAAGASIELGIVRGTEKRTVSVPLEDTER
jgi:serine protease Do